MSNTIEGYGKFIQAVAFAAHKHRDQRRKDAVASPYINHPIALADVLANEGGVDDEEVLCAAVLHDTVEDTETSASELVDLFGETIASIVLEVTDDKCLAKHERKQRQVDHAPHISPKAKLVKLADKICNVRDILASAPKGWSVQRQQRYLHWSAEVIDGVRGIHPELEAMFDGLYARCEELAGR